MWFRVLLELVSCQNRSSGAYLEIYPTEPIRRFFARLPSTIVPALTDAGGVCLLTGIPRQFLTAEFPERALIRLSRRTAG